MRHYCSIPSIGSDDIWCSETEDGHFEMGGIHVNFCPFCGAKAPKSGVPDKWIAKTFKEASEIESRLYRNRSEYVEYSNIISAS